MLNSNKFGFSSLKSIINKAIGWSSLVHIRHSSHITGFPDKSQLSADSIVVSFNARLTLLDTFVIFFRVKSFIKSLLNILFCSSVILSNISPIYLLLLAALSSSLFFFLSFSFTVSKISFDKDFN